MLNGLDLFSGTGALTLALHQWVRPICFCEIDRYAQGILLSRMADRQLPVAPIWDDIRTSKFGEINAEIDIVYGGPPCQDISYAGPGGGLEGKRSGLFFELCRVVEETQPAFVFLENVPAIRTRGLKSVVRALTDLRYDLRWTCVSAQEVGSPQKRARWFLLARRNRLTPNTSSKGLQRSTETRDISQSEKRSQEQFTRLSTTPFWNQETLDRLVRLDDGTSFRVDRIKALGNGVVPQQAREAFMRLSGMV